MTATRSSPNKLCILVLPLLFGTSAAGAQTSSFESEPNDTTAQANPIAGDTTVLGTMNDQDQDGPHQDARHPVRVRTYRYTVGPAD